MEAICENGLPIYGTLSNFNLTDLRKFLLLGTLWKYVYLLKLYNFYLQSLAVSFWFLWYTMVSGFPFIDLLAHIQIISAQTGTLI